MSSVSRQPPIAYRPMSTLKKSARAANTPDSASGSRRRDRMPARSNAAAAISSRARSLSTVVTMPMSIVRSASGMESKTAMARYQSAGTANEPRITVRLGAITTSRPNSCISHASSWPSRSSPCSTKTSRYGTLPSAIAEP